MTLAAEAAKESTEQFIRTFLAIREEVAKFIVGQEQLVEDVLLAIVAGGHVLLEGVPGLGKTALVHTISQALDLKFQRIQFTPDLLPADIVGTQVLMDRGGHKSLEFQPGPVFCNVLLADEINRATPKTQSALLETMQERGVTVAGRTYPIEAPFFVLATQNPIEQDGTFPLPEAQLDRFFFKLLVRMPSHADFAKILDRTGGNAQPQISVVATGDEILQMGRTLREVPIDETVQNYLIEIVRGTHPENDDAPADVKRLVRHGASPRGAQAMLAASRARALLAGRYHVSREDVQAVAVPALRHRIILSFEGEADGVRSDDVIRRVIQQLQ